MDHRKGSHVSLAEHTELRLRAFGGVFFLILLSVPFLLQAQTITQQGTVTVTAVVAAPGSGGGSTGGGSTGGGSSGGGSSGGGSTGGTVLGNEVIFRGTAYPGSLIDILKGGRVIAEQPASPDASFQISISGIEAGTYNFGVRAQDVDGRISDTQNFTVIVTTGVSTLVRGIFLTPTISLDKTVVKKGDIITVLGSSAPNSTVNVVVNSLTEITKSLVTNQDGRWLYKIDSAVLEEGDHQTKARGETSIDYSPYSRSLHFTVGTQNLVNTNPTTRTYDLTGDGRINIQDFSILAYWYRRPSPPARVDFNSDGKVDLIDFSILVYYWTG